MRHKIRSFRVDKMPFQSNKFNADLIPKGATFGEISSWGLSSFLDSKLQDGKKLPKWDSRSHRGMFVGVYHAQSSNGGCNLNFQTGYVSPQYHVPLQYHIVYDDLFPTVTHGETSEIIGIMPLHHREWLSTDELPLSIPFVPALTSSSPTINPSVPREPSPCLSSPEGDIFPLTTDAPEAPSTTLPEGDTSRIQNCLQNIVESRIQNIPHSQVQESNCEASVKVS
jgi:hypothetical protein